MLTKLAIIFCTILLTQSSSNSFIVQLTCEPCTISCTSSNCYRINGGGYNKQVCTADYSCPTSFATNVTITKCQTAENGLPCDTKLCYAGAQGKGCVADFSQAISYSCSTPYYFQFECGTCQSTPCSGKCLRFTTSLFETSNNEICFGQCPFSSQNVSISSCAGGLDWLGKTCDCCYSYTASTSSSNTSGLCTSTSNILGSSDFTVFGQAKTADKFEHHYGILFLLVLIASMIIY